jgi:hypothetical protein
MRETQVSLGCTRHRLLNRISSRLLKSAAKAQRADFNLLACGEMLASLKEDIRRRREEPASDLAEPAAA